MAERKIIHNIERFDNGLSGDNAKIAVLNKNFFQFHHDHHKSLIDPTDVDYYGRASFVPYDVCPHPAETTFFCDYEYDDEPGIVRRKILDIRRLHSGRIEEHLKITWAYGMIIGKTTGNILDDGYIEIELFNHAYDDRGNPFRLVKIKQKLVDLHGQNETLKGYVWKYAAPRDGHIWTGWYDWQQSLHGHDWNHWQYRAEDGFIYYPAPRASLEYPVDSSYSRFSPDLPKYEKLFGNKRYNYAVTESGRVRTIYDFKATGIYKTSFTWSAVFTNGSNRDNHDLDKIVRKGICYATHTAPTVSDTVVVTNRPHSYYMDGIQTVTGLAPETTYYARAFIERTKWIGEDTVIFYSDEITITTVALFRPAIIEHTEASKRGDGKIYVKAEILTKGEQEWTSCGFVYSSTNSTPTLEEGVVVSNNSIPGSSDLYYDNVITGLNKTSKYYIRAYVQTNTQTYYGSVSFESFEIKKSYDIGYWIKRNINESGFYEISPGTSNTVPVLTGIEFKSKTQTSAIVDIIYIHDGGSALTDYGLVLSKSPNPKITDRKISAKDQGSYDVSGKIMCEIKNLTPNATYYIKSYAVNSVGIGYGYEVRFEAERPPRFTNTSATKITANSATLNTTIDVQIPSKITRQGFIYSTWLMSDFKLRLEYDRPDGAPNREIAESLSVYSGQMSLKALLMVRGSKYSCRAFIEYGGEMIYSDIIYFTSLSNISVPTTELKNLEIDNQRQEIKVTMSTTDNGGATCVNYISISDVNSTLDYVSVKQDPSRLADDVGNFQKVFDMSEKAHGTYEIYGYSYNNQGIKYTNKIIVVYSELEKGMPVSYLGAGVTDSGMSLSAIISDIGNSTIISKSLKLKNITDTTEQTLTMLDVGDDSPSYGNSMYEYYNTEKLPENKEFELELSVETQYTVDNSEPYINTARFITPDRYIYDIVEEEISKPVEDQKQVSVSLEMIGYSNNKKFSPIFKVIITGQVEEGSEIKLCRVKELPGIKSNIDSTHILNNEGNDILSQKIDVLLNDEYIFETSMDLEGIYNFRAFYVENTLEYGSIIHRFHVYKDDLVSTSTSQVDGTSAMAIPLANLYAGKEYIHDNKKWTYDSTDQAWKRDYSYDANSKTIPSSGLTLETINVIIDDAITKLRSEIAEEYLTINDARTKIDAPIDPISTVEQLDMTVKPGMYSVIMQETYLPFKAYLANGGPVSLIVHEHVDVDVACQIAIVPGGGSALDMLVRYLSSGSGGTAPDYGWQKVVMNIFTE